MRKYIPILIVTALFLIHSNTAMAMGVGVVDDMIQKFADASKNWEGPLLDIAMRLFWLLATIQFAWAMIGLAFKASDFNTWISTIVTQIMFIGFMSWILMNFSSFAGYVIDSFRKAAGQASGQNLFSPSDFFVKAWKLVGDIYDQTSVLEPGNSLGLIIAGIIIMICFALICAFMVVTLVEMYIVISASVILMGFGGTQWTKDYAIRALQYAVSVGAKLFVLQLIAGLGATLMDDWISSADTQDFENIVGMIGCAIILLALTKMIPDIVQGIINGTSIAQGGALTSAMAAVGGGAIGAAIATGGQSAAISSSFKLASEQLKSPSTNGDAANSSQGGGKAGSMLGLITQAGKNYASGLAGDIGGRLTGQVSKHERSGTSLGGRISNSMDAKRESLASEREAKTNTRPNNKEGKNENTIY
ncbi:P-type conjugative transfer protein TrbL [Acinetobacter baumannii]|nr:MULTISPECIES: P-type conjugative transfer protein TrbL [Acinetobacter calcoaceticus/baumannii complex]MCT2603132.1 P-type conjugative transfer protein TrbL [Acinetobacter baumannii]MDA4856067.1 P-type conjugative transfer protein TrbL [Acinetobacter baumannii]MDC5234332.1 P-type conjugative transfer protein TrbL [Acinetobacter baumannii]